MTDHDRATARAAAATKYDEAAGEMEAAAAHLRLAAMHFRDADVPRGCAHAFAAYGHVRSGQRLIDENAIMHASKAQR